MSIQDGQAWFVALVWPNNLGVPAARVHEWDRQTGQVGKLVESFTYGEKLTFYDVLAGRNYQVVDGVLEQSVFHDGVLVALRQAVDPMP